MSSISNALLPRPTSTLVQRRPFCMLALAAALLLNFLFATGHDEQRCIELAMLLACAIGMSLDRRRNQCLSIASFPFRVCLTGFFALGLASVICALSVRHAVYEWSSLLLLALLTRRISTEAARAGTGAMTDILQWAGIACVLYSLRVLLMYAAALGNGYQIDMHGLAVGFSNMRFLNHTQTALMPLLLLLYLQTPAGTIRRAWFVLAAFWWSLLYVGEARASLVALAAGGVAVLCLRGRHAHGFLRAMVATALAGCVLYVSLFVLLPECAGLQPLGNVDNVMARTTSDPASGRQFLWSRAVQLIVAHPWLGVGPLHFAHYGADLKIGAHPHDWILQVAVEWGIPALLCLLGAIGVGMRAFLRAVASLAQTDRRQQETCVMFLAAILAIMVDALFSGVFVMPQSRLAVVLVVGCAAGWVRALAPQASWSGAPAARRPVTAMLVVFAACLLGWSVAPTLADRARHVPLRGVEQAANSGMHWPRMWEAGYF